MIDACCTHSYVENGRAKRAYAITDKRSRWLVGCLLTSRLSSDVVEQGGDGLMGDVRVRQYPCLDQRDAALLEVVHHRAGDVLTLV